MALYFREIPLRPGSGPTTKTHMQMGVNSGDEPAVLVAVS